MPIQELEKTATLDELRTDVAKITTTFYDALDDGVCSARRAVKHGRHAAEEAVHDARHAVGKIAFSAGVMTGCLAEWVAAHSHKAHQS